MENWRREGNVLWKHESIKMNACTTKSTLTCIRKWHGSIKSVIACYFGIWGKRGKSSSLSSLSIHTHYTQLQALQQLNEIREDFHYRSGRQEAWHISQRKSKVQQLQLPLELQKTWNLWLRKKGIIERHRQKENYFAIGTAHTTNTSSEPEQH